jgi:hypothetical protein
MRADLDRRVAVIACGAGTIGGAICRISGSEPAGRAGTVAEASAAAPVLCDLARRDLTGQLLLADAGWSTGHGCNV